jgi:hypothetical protein
MSPMDFAQPSVGGVLLKLGLCEFHLHNLSEFEILLRAKERLSVKEYQQFSEMVAGKWAQEFVMENGNPRAAPKQAQMRND